METAPSPLSRGMRVMTMILLPIKNQYGFPIMRRVNYDPDFGRKRRPRKPKASKIPTEKETDPDDVSPRERLKLALAPS